MKWRWENEEMPRGVTSPEKWEKMLKGSQDLSMGPERIESALKAQTTPPAPDLTQVLAPNTPIPQTMMKEK